MYKIRRGVETVLLYSLNEFCLDLKIMDNKRIGSGALSGKMLLVRIIENNKIDTYFRTG